MSKYMTVKEFAKEFHISQQAVYRLVEEESIPHYRIGKRILLCAEDFRKRGNDGSEQAE